MSDEMLMALAEWMKAASDTALMAYTVFAVVAIAVFLIAIIAEIWNVVGR